ncbi:MFS transporter [Psychrobacter sp.]|uniref:AmpG family muropeptide MFS transporter n=1 Tax=Psychrobacter sp. TaxID=56811 RepID=UPI00260004F6|nr:MFS transporter [Psychrobacter sp.]
MSVSTPTHKNGSKTELTLSPKRSWIDSLRAFKDLRVLIMFFLGFAAGLPIMLIFSSLGLWLNEAGVDLSIITMFSWAGLGYAFKFIWAPLIDAIPVPILTKWLGRRRAWMVVAQLLIILAIYLMASVNPAEVNVLHLMAAGSVLLGFSAATQDIVIDAYRIELAPPEMQPVLSSIYVTGYRIGMIVAGAGSLYLAAYFGSTETVYSYEAWRNTYYVMGVIMTLPLLTTFAGYEPTAEILQVKKQQFNLKLFSIYSAILLIPGIFVGLPYLIETLFNRLAGSSIVLVPASVYPVLNDYFSVAIGIAPLLLLFLFMNQPKIINKAPTVTESKNDYLRLVLVFLLSVAVFIAGYNLIGKVLPEFEDALAMFLIATFRLLASLALAIVSGLLLVKVGLVKKEVALATWINPIMDFFRRYGKKALLLLALIGLYRISDIVAGVISNVFYQEMGFDKTQIADAVKLVGVIMAIVGGFLGGMLAQRMRIMQVMMLGAILASTTNLLFILLTYHQGSVEYMYFAVIFDNLASGFASMVFIAFLSALTSIKFTAVQYAIFSSIMTLIPKVIGGYSGSIVEATSWPFFFFFTFLIGIPILVLIYLVDKFIVIGGNDDIYDKDVLKGIVEGNQAHQDDKKT